MNLNGTHQILFYAEDVNILRGSVHIIREKTATLLVASKEIDLEINPDKKSARSCRDESQYIE